MVDFLELLLLIKGLSGKIFSELSSTLLLTLALSHVSSEPTVLCDKGLMLPIKIFVVSELFGALLPQVSELSLTLSQNLIEMDVLLLEFAILFLIVETLEMHIVHFLREVFDLLLTLIFFV